MTAMPGTTNYYAVDFLAHVNGPDGVSYIDARSPYSKVTTNVACLPPLQGTNGVDVVFIVDNTVSMDEMYIYGGNMEPYRTAIDQTVDYIVAASSNNYRLALVTPDNDQVDVRVGFTTNINAFISAVNTFMMTSDPGVPESTDECLNTVVNALTASGRTNVIGCAPAKPTLQYNDFRPAFRTNAVKLVILITDAPPSGFCDSTNEPYDTNYMTYAHTYALEAATNHIKINAIQMGNTSVEDFTDAQAMMQNYATTTCGWYSQLDYYETFFEKPFINNLMVDILNVFYTNNVCQ
jgi:hypothetical protein